MGGILVLAGKDVGARTLRYLIGKEAPIEEVILGSADDTEVADAAKAAGIRHGTWSPATRERLLTASHRYEWILSLWNPHILKADILALADRRLNLHPGHMPALRGQDTAAWAIRRGLPAGVAILDMDAGVDTGGVYVQKQVPYEPLARGADLFARLKVEIGDLFEEHWPAIYAGDIHPVPQGPGGNSFTRRMTNEDRVVKADAQFTAGEFLIWARAHDFYPRSTAEIEFEGRRVKICIEIEDSDI